MSKLGMELSKVLFAHEPKLLASDIEASTRAAFEVSNLLGCVMATVIVREGEAKYLEAMRAVMTRVNESAIATARRASEIVPNTTRQ